MTTSASPEEISPIRQTKIIATLGPAVASGEAISALVGAGMNVARLNFSHGNHENHRAINPRTLARSCALIR